MTFKVFISHSMDEMDRGFLEKLDKNLSCHGIEPYLAEDNPKYGKNISDKIKKNLNSSNLVIALYSKSGSTSAFVNQEIGYAVKAGKPTVILRTPDVHVKGLTYGCEDVVIDPKNPEEALKNISDFSLKLKMEKEQQDM